MNKTWEQNNWSPEPSAADQYRVQIYEDAEGRESSIFVVERMDGQPISGDEARILHSTLSEDANIEVSKSKFWEQRPDGQLFEHSHSVQGERDMNPLQSDLGTHLYQQAVDDGDLEPEMVESVFFSRQEVPSEVAQQTTGHEIQSWLQQQNQEFSRMKGPSQWDE